VICEQVCFFWTLSFIFFWGEKIHTHTTAIFFCRWLQ
jgi:hypothetical protein